MPCRGVDDAFTAFRSADSAIAPPLSADIAITAAPSWMSEALPGSTVPSFLKAGRRAPSFSAVVPVLRGSDDHDIAMHEILRM
jgi:hypothetical protein